MSLVVAVSLVVGLVLLIGGGELLVRGGGGLGRTLGMSPLVVGLTIVAFATSAPELAVSLDATLSGSPGLAVGNVVGSNITNVLLVLGLAAVILPLAAQRQLVRFDVPFVIVVSVLALLLMLDGSIGRVDGVLLVALLAAYVVWTVLLGRRAGTDDPPPGAAVPALSRPLVDVVLVVVGIALLVLGARLLVSAATSIATAFGVSDLVIGLTVVAVGTSLPEVATSVIAAIRGETEMAVGNVVGSNVFNLTAVLGLTAVIAPDGVPVEAAAIRFDVPVMIAVALALLPILFTGMVIARWEGGVFLAMYAGYVAYLLLAAAQHDALPAFSTVMLGFVVPLTALTIAVLVVQEIRLLRRRG
ncbi:cation:H+ antiporter [Nocardioides massiliensis]|uniref:Cation:H+ antiporter n=1 Tax=Nocardioides massiliensis TaxID=1325935 RepID=A0ABT9NRK1_9ACTN|nr:calcium/sodium antiporter [Nocardioides massiliensis]MDP9822946.1 cation:H+ antiporter [Nocardioides massiliensis]